MGAAGRRFSGRELGSCRLPIPGQKLIEMDVVIVDAVSTSVSQACGLASLSRAVWIRVYITAARSPRVNVSQRLSM
jgi:hypothetical protein